MKKLFTLLLAAASLAACQNDGRENAVPQSDRVAIDPIITRATEVNFEKDDRIGLTILRGETAYASNTLLTFADGVFSGSLVWYSEAAQTSTLIAYYPYDEAGAPTSFSVAADQTTGYGASDLMAAVKSGVTPSAGAVNMVFKHQMSKILINVTNDSGSDISTVKLQGSIPAATVDLAALTVAVDETAAAADITAQQVEANTTYRALVVPQTVGFQLCVTTAAGQTLTQSLATMTLKQGGQYTVNVRVTSDDLKVTASGEIENWTDEGVIPEAPAEVSFEEHDGYFLYDGERYNTVTLSNGTTWMAEPMRYIPEGLTPSSDPLADAHIWYPYQLTLNESAANINDTTATPLTDAESVRAKGYLYDFYAAFGNREVTAENCTGFEGVQGICPKGWHIPTRAEFYALCGLSNKAAEGESGNQTDETALFFDSGYKGGKTTLFSAAGWNYTLSGTRLQSNFASNPSYQGSIICDRNTVAGTTPAEYFGQPALTYIMSSTCYKPIYSTANPDELTNIQFFAQMTTFTTVYPEGRVNLAYIGTKSGMQLRCVKDQAR